MCNKDLKKIVRYLYECNKDIDIDIYTNGSAHDAEWWEDLASIIKGYKGTVIFGIDGIGETHAIHRCNTNYNKIIENATAYINAGGNAQWEKFKNKKNINK